MSQFRNFKMTYNKKYASNEEEAIRFLIFSENVKKIEAINAQETSFTVGINLFADLTTEEYKALYLGYRKKDTTTRGTKIRYLDTSDTPNAVDWRSIVNPVKDQGGCGSCWAFSAVAGVEAIYAQKTGKVVSFSEQQVVDCDKEDWGCDGGDLPPAFEYMI